MRLGEREQRIERLDLAVSLYRSVLEIWTPERNPGEWAHAECGLVDALTVSGELRWDMRDLEEAAALAKTLLVNVVRYKQFEYEFIAKNRLDHVLRVLGRRVDIAETQENLGPSVSRSSRPAMTPATTGAAPGTATQ